MYGIICLSRFLIRYLCGLCLCLEEFHKAVHGAFPIVGLGVACGVLIDESGEALNLHAGRLLRLFFGADHGDGNSAPADKNGALAYEFLEGRLHFLAVATPVGIIHSKGANRGRRGGLNDTTLSEAFKFDVEVKVNIDKSEHYNGKKNVSTTGQLWGGHRDVDFYMGGGMFSVVDRCWMFGCPMSTWDLFF